MKSNSSNQQCIEDQLSSIRTKFYHKDQLSVFYRDRQGLIYAISWLGGWLEQRSLYMTKDKYKSWFEARLNEIHYHGDSEKYQSYFPAYLLKCIQTYLKHHGEKLYFELKQMQNLSSLVLQNINDQQQNQQHFCRLMAEVHQVLSTKQSRKSRRVEQQLQLF